MKYLLLLIFCLTVLAAPQQSTSSDAQELLQTAYSQYRAGKLAEAFQSERLSRSRSARIHPRRAAKIEERV